MSFFCINYERNGKLCDTAHFLGKNFDYRIRLVLWALAYKFVVNLKDEL